MRILAIRGENLASLAALFEIDLTREPLAGAGLFAITGDTGAGKSTILDALCLALYNDYPRAQTGTKESTPDPSGSEIQASDSRNILRRSAGVGYAEVDFVGQDGLSYRARWAARRARERATGRLQNVERKLDRLDGGGNIAVGISDVAASVVEKTGLTYDQFCRTVLLAQGEFDTFLLATEKDRADLLEKITGTDIYSRVSVRVHEEKDKREREIEKRNASLAGIEVLSSEARHALAQEQSEKAVTLAAVEQAQHALATQRQRANDIRSVRAHLASAQQMLTDADSRWQAAAPEIEQLEALDAIAPIRPLVDARTTGRERLVTAEAALAASQETATTAATTLAISSATASEASEAARIARANITQFQPQWDRAAALDADIRTAARERDDTAAQCAHAKERRDALNAQLDGAKARVASLTIKRSEINAQRDAQAAIAPLHEHRERLSELFDDNNRITTSLAAARSTRSAKERDLSAIAARLASLDGDARATHDSLLQSQARLDDCRKKIASLRLDEVDKRDRALQKLDRLLANAASAISERDFARTILASVQAARSEADIVAQDSAARIAALERARETAETKRDALAPLADLAEAATSRQADALRTRLVDNEPCPVCGSREHPYASEAAHAALAQKIIADRTALDAEIAHLQREIMVERGKEADARARTTSAVERAQEQTEKRDGAIGALSLLLPEVAGAAQKAEIALTGVATSPPEILSISAMTAAIAAVAARTQEIENIRRASFDLAKVREQLETEIGALADAVAKAEDAAKHDRVLIERLRVDIARLSATCDGLDGEQIRTRAALEPFLKVAGIKADVLDDSADDARRRITVLADDYASLVQTLAELDADLLVAQRDLTAAETSTSAADSELVRLTADVERRRETHVELTAARAPLLGGEPTSDHRERHEKALADIELKAQRALDTHRAAEIAQVRAAGFLTSAHAARDEAAIELRNADEAYASALTRSGWDDARVAALLAIPAAVRDEISDRIEQIRADRRNAITTLETRQSDLAGLAPRDDEATDDAVSSIDASLSRADDEIAALRKRATEIELVLGRDDEIIAKLSTQRREIEDLQTELNVWRAVHDAVGSADGAKFKRYAQGITLRHLVALSNLQLAALNPRYALRQSATSSLALDVIDRDMGEDARSPRSLSGGERFLISLALALALSGLEGRQSFVDTLFIDEGFGSLDRETLDIAIDALETLQGQGRKVGLITHVQAMMDRIAVQIRVEKRGGGRSVVQVSDSTGGLPVAAVSASNA